MWRPSSVTGGDGCFALVGENILSDGTAAEDGLISKIPEPDDIISVSPGDVVGYYSQSGSEGDTTSATEILLDRTYVDETVWYHTNTKRDPLITSSLKCPFPVGLNKMLGSHTNAAPVLSIDMGE